MDTVRILDSMLLDTLDQSFTDSRGAEAELTIPEEYPDAQRYMVIASQTSQLPDISL